MTMMKDIWKSHWLSFLFRLIIGIVFIYASLDKIVYPENFSDQIENYQMLPTSMVNTFAMVLPAMELLTGVCLIIGIATVEATLIMAGMLTIFIIALMYATISGINTDCGCFSSHEGSHPVGWDRVIEDFLLLVCCFHILLYDKTQFLRKLLHLS